jgi:hypothetical protein
LPTLISGSSTGRAKSCAGSLPPGPHVIRKLPDWPPSWRSWSRRSSDEAGLPRVGPQGPPALHSAGLVAVAALRAGPSCITNLPNLHDPRRFRAKRLIWLGLGRWRFVP